LRGCYLLKAVDESLLRANINTKGILSPLKLSLAFRRLGGTDAAALAQVELSGCITGHRPDFGVLGFFRV
jgi:hypothetical protein